jgi:TM2 domain-containing membrane protein YozV
MTFYDPNFPPPSSPPPPSPEPPSFPPPPPPPHAYFKPPHLADANQKKLLAGLLAIFLGNLGIHKFILGYNTAGAIMLILNFTCLGVPVIRVISLIEGIIYLTKSDEEFYNTYIANQREWF